MSEPLVVAPHDVPSIVELSMTGLQYRGSKDSHGEYLVECVVSRVPSGASPAGTATQFTHPARGLTRPVVDGNEDDAVNGATPTWYPSALKSRVASSRLDGDSSGEKTPVGASVSLTTLTGDRETDAM